MEEALLEVYECIIGASGLTFGAYKILEDWDEATVTWGTQPQWSYTYEDYIVTDSSPGWWEFDISELCREWVYGTDNYGVSIYYQGSGCSFPYVYSSDYSGTSYRPKLTVDYCFDEETPYGDGFDPQDGETDVPSDSNVVFHLCDELAGIDVDTIHFSIEDTSRAPGAGGNFVGVGDPMPARHIAGDLEIDDDDIHDVVCTFDPDDPLDADVITCTVDGSLADMLGNPVGDDIVWSFSVEGIETAVQDTTWGVIKAGF
ncbi:MAG: hypothetical protein A2Y64_01705 [Candidatus Coatesbacteria bacterium RBG_13_66_14]|uniref:Carbohydrate-binding module family 96 domain-containing protein n=1 Tax=Candidatus Coatesbacteria bacterium RBG_13_66_14 TaxID=1817816 RepID=A0A1F5F487_9BACT|nr:MAG: hypothetical protein A2Y64_01705 [Candidatus Coatesbacteria bacterium RBG_13_66_14]